MKRSAAPEMVSVTVENSDHARTLIKTTHDFIRDPAQVAALDAETAKPLPLDRIVESVTFASKGSSALQVADAVAFSIMRRLRRVGTASGSTIPWSPSNFAVLDTLLPGEWHEKLDGGESDSG